MNNNRTNLFHDINKESIIFQLHFHTVSPRHLGLKKSNIFRKNKKWRENRENCCDPERCFVALIINGLNTCYTRSYLIFYGYFWWWYLWIPIIGSTLQMIKSHFKLKWICKVCCVTIRYKFLFCLTLPFVKTSPNLISVWFQSAIQRHINIGTFSFLLLSQLILLATEKGAENQ